jgi:hypothetical protein
MIPPIELAPAPAAVVVDASACVEDGDGFGRRVRIMTPLTLRYAERRERVDSISGGVGNDGDEAVTREVEDVDAARGELRWPLANAVESVAIVRLARVFLYLERGRR